MRKIKKLNSKWQNGKSCLTIARAKQAKYLCQYLLILVWIVFSVLAYLLSCSLAGWLAGWLAVSLHFIHFLSPIHFCIFYAGLFVCLLAYLPVLHTGWLNVSCSLTRLLNRSLAVNVCFYCGFTFVSLRFFSFAITQGWFFSVCFCTVVSYFKLQSQFKRLVKCFTCSPLSFSLFANLCLNNFELKWINNEMVMGDGGAVDGIGYENEERIKA